MNSLITKIEDIIYKDSKIHYEYGEDMYIENYHEISMKIFDVCMKHREEQ